MGESEQKKIPFTAPGRRVLGTVGFMGLRFFPRRCVVSPKLYSKKIYFFFFLILILGLGACAKQDGEGAPEGSKFGAPDGGDSGTGTGENSLGYDQRTDEKTPTVPPPTSPPISDNCLTTHVGDPLCKLVVVQIESQGGILGMPAGYMTYKYDTQGRVTESKLFDSTHPNPLQTILTTYDANGAKLTDVITNDFDFNGKVDGMDFTDTLLNSDASVPNLLTLKYLRDGQTDFDVTHYLISNGPKIIGDIVRVYPAGNTSSLIEQIYTVFNWNSSTQQLDDTNIYHSLKGPNDPFIKLVTRNFNKYSYTNQYGDWLLSQAISQTYDCQYGVDCTVDPMTTQGSTQLFPIRTMYSSTGVTRDGNGKLESMVIYTFLRNFTDKNKQPNDPSHPYSSTTANCLVWYLNNAYQVKELPPAIKQIFGGSLLAPTVLECTDQNNATSNLNIRWDTLYNAAGVPPPG